MTLNTEFTESKPKREDVHCQLLLKLHTSFQDNIYV